MHPCISDAATKKPYRSNVQFDLYGFSFISLLSLQRPLLPSHRLRPLFCIRCGSRNYHLHPTVREHIRFPSACQEHMQDIPMRFCILHQGQSCCRDILMWSLREKRGCSLRRMRSAACLSGRQYSPSSRCRSLITL